MAGPRPIKNVQLETAALTDGDSFPGLRNAAGDKLTRYSTDFLRRATIKRGLVDITLGAGPTDARAVGDGTTDCAQAFLDAFVVLRAAGGGTLWLPPGTFRTSVDLTPDATILMRGCGRAASTILPDVGKKLWLRHTSQSGGQGDAVGSRLDDFTIRCNTAHFPELAAPHSYGAGDRLRSHVVALSQGNVRDVDLGVHLLCIQAGTTANLTIPTNRVGDTFTNGTAVFEIEDWSGLTVSTPYVRVSGVDINFATDNGVYVYGHIVGNQDVGIGDSCFFDHVRVNTGDGHGFFLSGEDSQNNAFFLCNAQFFSRGVGFYDTAFLGNKFDTCSAILNRRNWQLSGSVWPSTASECYAEASTELGGILIEAPNLWLAGTGEPSADPRATGLFFDGRVWQNGLTIRAPDGTVETRGGARGLVSVSTPYDVGALDTQLTITAEDPAGFQRRSWSVAPLYAVSEDVIGLRSIHVPGKVRYPRGFYLGANETPQRQILRISLNRAPEVNDITFTGTRLYGEGDRVDNTNGGEDEPEGWRAQRDGGWGGGLLFGGGRTWVTGGLLRIGSEGIEPTGGGLAGHLFRIMWIELETSPGVWSRDATQALVTLSATEPTWLASPALTYEQLALGALVANQTHRIVYEDYALSGMDWDELARPTRTVST